MAIVDRKLHWNGATGKRSAKKRQYTAVWKIVTDDANDQAQTVLDDFEANVMAIGFAAYVFGNDSDLLAILKELTPGRDLRSAYHWQVTGLFESPEKEEEDREDKDTGEPTTDPTRWENEWSIRSVKETRVVAKATYRSGFTGGTALLWPAGSVGPPMASNLVPFDPPDDKTVSLMGIRITTRTFDYNFETWQEYIDSVNDSEWNVLPPGRTWDPTNVLTGHQWTFPAYMAKCIDVAGTWQATNSVKHWRIDLDFLIEHKDLLHGWRPEYLDHGISALWIPGEPDGFGGSASAGDMVDGRPRHRRLLDGSFKPIPHRVLLDGDGQPLKLDSSTPIPDPVYSVWSKYEEKDFNKLTRGNHPPTT